MPEQHPASVHDAAVRERAGTAGERPELKEQHTDQNKPGNRMRLPFS